MKKPNFVVFMADHLRWDMLPPYGRAKMPNVEKLAGEAVIFDSAYCSTPHCCPSRASFFTGKYATEHGVWNNVSVGNALSRGPFDGVPLFTDRLQKNGYQLYYAGKWHVSARKAPQDYGFTEGHVTSREILPLLEEGSMTREWESYYDGPLSAAGKERAEGEILRDGYPEYHLYGTAENPFGDQQIVSSAVEMAGQLQEPFFFYTGVNSPHDPYIPPEKFLNGEPLPTLPDSFDDSMEDKPNLYKKTRRPYMQLTEREHREAIRHYLAFCAYVDDCFGRLYHALEEQGKLDNTVILFTSDHADYCGEHGLYAKGLPCFGSAYHIPVLFWKKGGFPASGKVIRDFVSITDFAPTFTELAGCPGVYSGQSLTPFLSGRKPEHWREALFTQSNGNELYGIQRSVMTRKWKYVYNGFDFDELYDMENDPQQMHNLISVPGNRETLKELCTMLWQFARAHQDNCINPYIMVAHAPFGPGMAGRGKI